MRPQQRFFQVIVPSMLITIGLACYGLTQESAVITGEAGKSVAAPKASPPPAAQDLAHINLEDLLLARRAAAIEAAQRAIDEEIDDAMAEHRRQGKELSEWIAKEREKLGLGQATAPPAASTAKRK